MIKHLCKIPGIETAILKYAFNKQSKPKGSEFAKMQFKFIDSEGKKYYRYYDDFDIPVMRFEQLQIKLREIESRISNEHLDKWIEVIEKILSKGDKQKAAIEAIQMIGTLKQRREVLYEEKLLMQLVCILYIREDQDATIWDEEIEKYKFERLKADQTGGLRDFFIMAGLNEFLPSLKDMQSGWEKFLENQKQQIEAFDNMTDQVNLIT